MGTVRHRMGSAVVVLVGCLLPTRTTAIAAAERPPLRFCFSAAAMPRAGKAADGTPQGVDVEVAKLLASELNRRYEIHWCANDTCRLRNLRANRCDVVIGLPHDSVDAPDIAWAKSYAAAKFGLVVAAQERQIRSLHELRGRRVGLVRGTLRLSPKEHRVVGFSSRAALLRGFRRAELDAAFIDADFAAWYLNQHPDIKLRLVDEFVSPYRWAVGIAVRANDAGLRTELSRAVEDCVQRARFPAQFAKYGLVYRPPLVDAPAKGPKASGSTWRHVVDTGILVVSMDPANLPYSSADADKPGFDVEIARVTADELGVRLKLQWMDIHRETAIGQLLDRECDLAFGAAIDPDAMDDEEELAGKVIYSRPYYGTGYMLIARAGAPPVTALGDLQGERSRRLGTQAGTIADYALRQRGYMRRLFGTQLGVLSALEKGTIDYAYMWSNIHWMLHNDPKLHVKPIAGYVPEDRWNMAVAMRRGDSELKQHVDQALERIMRRGGIARALAHYHMPFFSPFEHSGDAAANATGAATAAPTRRQPVDRGREPEMSRRRRSNQRYDGLRAIRARGTLVVGLDQNNLPFSTAHPQPSGIDYEVAQLLARQLGVSLDVFWAYSSHDSYPSKLATKRLCDVMLGVMPDDRFGHRVAFSRPYYFAEYVVAVSSNRHAVDATGAFESGPIAVEPGLAVRGLDGRQVRSFGSLASILAAVASGEVAAGYVLSSRAHWLAAQRWPGRIRFLTRRSAVDRFPICAAMRRDETELQNAVNAAFDQLRRSGRLARVFARWHIPFDETVTHDQWVP